MALFHSSLKELVRENITISKIVKPVPNKQFLKEIIYEVILLPPKEHFFQGADPVLREMLQNITKRRVMGHVAVFLQRFGKDFPLKNIANFGVRHRIREGEIIAVISEFYPFYKLYGGEHDRNKILARFARRGVGSKVLKAVLEDLKATGIRLVRTGVIANRAFSAIPLFKAAGFTELSKTNVCSTFAKII